MPGMILDLLICLRLHDQYCGTLRIRLPSLNHCSYSSHVLFLKTSDWYIEKRRTNLLVYILQPPTGYGSSGCIFP